MATPCTLLHIEPDTLLAALIGRLIRGWRDVCYMGTASNGQSGAEMCKRLRPAVVILELALPDTDGFVTVQELARIPQAPKLLAFTSHKDESTLFQVSRAPLNGIVWKAAKAARELHRAVATVARGCTYFTDEYREAARAFTQRPDAFFKILSTRELQFLPHFGKGLDDGAIAARMGVTAATVHSHRQRVMAKLNLHSSKDLIRWIEEKGFVHRSMPSLICDLTKTPKVNQVV